ncbi:DnaJ protein P58IPK B [Asimina triloba]
MGSVLGDEDKRVRYDTGEDIEDTGMGGGGFNPFGNPFGSGGGGQQFTFHFQDGGAEFPGGFGFHF